MVRKFEFTDILGWSHSRYATFKTCKRQYFYNYYGKSDQENLIQINFLKALSSVPLEIGNISHKILSVVLHRFQSTASDINRDKFRDYTLRRSREIFESKVFSEVYYDQRESIKFEPEILEPVSSALMNFIESDRLNWIREEALVEKEDWLIEPGGYGECRIDGMKAYCKVDFLFPIGEELHVIDWKTGKVDTNKHMDQLRGYATWAAFHYDKSYEQIEPTIAYLLPNYRENSLKLNEYDITEFSKRIRRESEQMYEYCEDPEFNIPLPKEEFSLTENQKICAYCNFRELCGREDIKPQKG